LFCCARPLAMTTMHFYCIRYDLCLSDCSPDFVFKQFELLPLFVSDFYD